MLWRDFAETMFSHVFQPKYRACCKYQWHCCVLLNIKTSVLSARLCIHCGRRDVIRQVSGYQVLLIKTLNRPRRHLYCLRMILIGLFRIVVLTIKANDGYILLKRRDRGYLNKPKTDFDTVHEVICIVKLLS